MEIRRFGSAIAAAAVAGLLALGVNQAVIAGSALEAVPAPDAGVDGRVSQARVDWAGAAVRAALLAGPESAADPATGATADRLAAVESQPTLPQDGPVVSTPVPTSQVNWEPGSVAPKVPRPGAAPGQDGVGNVNIATGRLLSKPLEGTITSRFGTRFHPILKIWKLHSGLDFSAPCGTAVGASAPGIVIRTGWAGGNGMQVKVDHGQIAGYNVVTTYNHLSSIGVQVGQRVAVHQGVGRVGSTGYSTGCHLHLEVIVNGHFTNPEAWLNGSAVTVDAAAMGATVPGSGKATPPKTASAAASPSPMVPATSLPPSTTQSPSTGTAPSTPGASETTASGPSTPPTTTPGSSQTPCVSPTSTHTAGGDGQPSPVPSPSACITPSESQEPSASPPATTSAPASPSPSDSSAAPTQTSAAPTQTSAAPTQSRSGGGSESPTRSQPVDDGSPSSTASRLDETESANP